MLLMKRKLSDSLVQIYACCTPLGEPLSSSTCRAELKDKGHTWEPKDHLPADLVEAFENPDPDPVPVEEARERIGLVFERGMKVPLKYEESIKIRHNLVHFLFPSLPADFRAMPINLQDQDLQRAGLETYPVFWCLPHLHRV